MTTKKVIRRVRKKEKIFMTYTQQWCFATGGRRDGMRVHMHFALEGGSRMRDLEGVGGRLIERWLITTRILGWVGTVWIPLFARFGLGFQVEGIVAFVTLLMSCF